jgi:pimeloyl-ACP methyl ester carboxylesterase
VVLLHGQPGLAGDWKAVADDLAADHLVIVPDRLGYGLTDGRAAGFAANAGAVTRMLRSLEVEGAVVVGHSWAGGVALQLAVSYPSVVKGLVLVCSVVPGEALGRFDRLLARPVIGTAFAAVTLSTAGRLLSWGPARAFAGRKLRGRPEQQLAAMARSWRNPSTWRSFAIEQQALVHELGRLAPCLGSLRVPATVIIGSADKVVRPQAGRRLAAQLQGSDLEEVEAGGHLLPQLHPTTVASAIRRLAGRVL